jgi:hypothetical protein
LAFVTLVVASACEPGPLDAIGLAPGTLADNLIAHYTFDEGSGTTIVDHSGNMHDGVLTGGSWITDGEFGGALRLSGSDYASVPNFPNAPPSFSVSAWVRTNDTPMDGYETVLSTEVVFESGWELNLNKLTGIGAQAAYSNGMGTYIRNDCTCLTANQWTHVVFVLNGDDSTLSLYVSAQLVESVPATQPIIPGTPALSIGRWSGEGRFLVGDLDDVAIYGRALVAAEIEELEQGPAPDLL